MEKTADKLGCLIKEKLALYEALYNSFEKEKHALKEMDLDALWQINAEKKQLVHKLELSEYHLVSMFRGWSGEPGVKEDAFSLSDHIGSLPVSRKTKFELKRLCSGLKTIAQKVADLASANRRYVNESLAVINDIFSTVVNHKASNQYNRAGALNTPYGQKNLISAEV